LEEEMLLDIEGEPKRIAHRDVIATVVPLMADTPSR